MLTFLSKILEFCMKKLKTPIILYRTPIRQNRKKKYKYVNT